MTTLTGTGLEVVNIPEVWTRSRCGNAEEIRISPRQLLLRRSKQMKVLEATSDLMASIASAGCDRVLDVGYAPVGERGARTFSQLPRQSACSHPSTF